MGQVQPTHLQGHLLLARVVAVVEQTAERLAQVEPVEAVLDQMGTPTLRLARQTQVAVAALAEQSAPQDRVLLVVPES